MIPDTKSARAAGFWYVAIAVCSSFSMIYVDQAFIVEGDAAATARAIEAARPLFLAGMMSCLAGHLCFLFLANALFKLFRGVSEDRARMMVILVIAGVAVSFAARLNQAGALLFLGGGSRFSVFSPPQLQALGMAFLELHRLGEKMALLFWALWLLPLGLLVLRSGFMPPAMGLLLIGTCASYLADFVIFWFFRDFTALDTVFSMFQTLAELSFIAILLVTGYKPRRGAAAAA